MRYSTQIKPISYVRPTPRNSWTGSLRSASPSSSPRMARHGLYWSMSTPTRSPRRQWRCFRSWRSAGKEIAAGKTYPIEDVIAEIAQPVSPEWESRKRGCQKIRLPLRPPCPMIYPVRITSAAWRS